MKKFNFREYSRKSVVKKMGATVLIGAMTAACSVGCAAVKSQDEVNGENLNLDNVVYEEKKEESSNYADTITLVWYPNESAENFTSSRDEIGRLIEQATGKKVEQKLTTDYAIAIESVANGTAQIGCVFGAEGYIQAKNSNDAVNTLFVSSGASGTLDDAVYYSFFSVAEGNASDYLDGDSYSIQNIQGKKMSFVSNTSTSGFKVPTNSIISYFDEDSVWGNLTVDDLLEGGKDAFFGEVMFGGSHQGSAFNLMSGKAEIAAFCNTEINPYAECISGEENQTGAVYQINEGAEAPFDTVGGKTFTVISSTPVMNGPFVYNSDTLSPEDVKAIQDLFTSDEVTNNTKIFYPADSEEKGLTKKTADEKYVIVEDSWYDPIRNMK